MVGCIKNRPLQLIMEPDSRDRREALRKLHADNRPSCRGRQMALLKQLMHPHLNSATSDAEHIDKVSEWQNTVRVCEGISGQGSNATV